MPLGKVIVNPSVETVSKKHCKLALHMCAGCLMRQKVAMKRGSAKTVEHH